MDAEKDALRDRESLGVAALRRQRFLQDRYGLRKGGLARPARAHPSIGEPRRAAQRVGMADAHPDRRARLLHRLRHHRLVFEVVEGAVIGDLVFGPQRLDEVHLLAEAAHPALFRHLELAVMMIAPEPHPEDCAAIADIIETRPLMRDHQRAVDRQNDDRRTKPDLCRDRRRIGQDDDGVEAEDMVERVLGDPQIAEAERLGALRDPAQLAHIDRLGRAVRQ